MDNINHNTVVVYEGQSAIDGEPVVALLSGLENQTKNSKLGKYILQLWIIRADMYPKEAIASKGDYSVCGKCPLRKDVCYVNQAPVNIMYKAYKQGRYAHISPLIMDEIRLRGFGLRLTAYGDQAAIPKYVLDKIRAVCEYTLSYTHSWLIKPELKGYAQASTETVAATQLAQSKGWSTFRVKTEDDPLLPNEIQCPNDLDDRVKCAKCKLCNGTNDIATDIGGLKYRQRNYISKFSS